MAQLNRSRCSVFLAGVVLVVTCLSLPAVALATNPWDKPRAPLRAQCTFNGECAPGLVCSNAMCRAECQTERDCSENKVCVDGLYSGQGQLLHIGRSAVPAGAAISLPPGAYYAARCQARAAQPAGTLAPSSSPVVVGAVVQGPLAITGVELAASPAAQSAKCPATVTFNGWIGASSSGAVTYRIIRSDGGTGAPKVVKFEAGGQKKISEAWTLGQSTKGSLTIEVLSPGHLTSAPAAFTLDCAS